MVEEAITWGEEKDDAAIEAFVVEVNAEITKNLVVINATAAYIYLNDADEGQDAELWKGYPAANVLRSKEVRDKYDPDMVFTNLMPGGYNVARV